MLRIMFVCHGNICRSPMAEFIMRKMLAENGLSDKVSVSSSATSTEEIWNGVGNPVYPPAREELRKHGISCEGKRAVQLRHDDLEKYDMFIGMDSMNIRNMTRILGDGARDRIFRLLSFAGRESDVADPWYSGNFEVTYSDIYEGCTALLSYLKENGYV